MATLKETSVQYIKGVGPARAKLFAQLGIATVEDLLYFFPRRYEDRSKLTPIDQVKVGQWQTITGKVINSSGRKTWFTKKRVYEAVIGDEKGRITCVWFNQPYLEHYFKDGLDVVLHGKVEVYKNRIQMIAPEYELLDKDEDDQSLNIGRIVPIYSLTRGMSQRYLRKVVRAALERCGDQLNDLLPGPLRTKYRLPSIRNSIDSIHYPKSFQEQEEALRRISFEEFFFFQVSVILRRMSIISKDGISHNIDQDLIEKFGKIFSFSLTRAQKRVIQEIASDMNKPSPMLRLLQGDVGSGKTLVALFGCVAAYANHCQSAIMAPTEVLALQHYSTISAMLKAGPFKGMKVALLIGSTKPKEKADIYQQLRDGSLDLVIGTHALLSEDVQFKKLSFIVIDEQHKFGVRQRALLSGKGTNPDVLIMTATPIPRTLCMTLYGDLDTSTLDEMPPGRGKVTTKIVALDQDEAAYAQVRKLVASGQQAYVVYPLIDESETLEIKAAQKMFKEFQSRTFKEFRVGMVHGQMKRQDVDATMVKFKNKEIDILVATTILEVGVDVPNANVLIVEHAERFGLSQLHQLRGRIGRGAQNALCLLIAEPETDEAKARLDAIKSTTDGFKIAECDLLIRGPGQYFGRHQHGLNELRVANPVKQIDILEIARKEAIELVKNDPKLEKGPDALIMKVVQERYPQYLQMVEAG